MQRKLITFCMFFLLFLSFFAKEVKSLQEFTIFVKASYFIKGNANTRVEYEITLENNFSTIYASSYSLFFENIKIKNPKAYIKDREIPIEVYQDNQKTQVKVLFNEPVVGKGEKQNFRIVFEDDSLAKKRGEVLEVTIPKVESKENYADYQTFIYVPEEFGEVSYIYPQPSKSEKKDGFNVLYFAKELLGASSISVAFGSFQVFDFQLNYHLENPLQKEAKTKIALPPDTAFQRVYFFSLDPQPFNVEVDEDGNWLATYILKPREKVDVKLVGSVQIFAKPLDFPQPSPEVLNKNLLPTKYWQADDQQIKELAKNLNNPKAIYDFVVNYLQYDYNRLKGVKVERFGAKEALLKKNEALCMEYTDLFIALSRAAGIPAREVNGYAFSENPEVQPLSLVADVLHAWPEYYDFNKRNWIPIDPTWGSTSKGIDYFEKFDFRHFTFVIHGQDDTQPYPAGSYKLGPEPVKDVYVSYGNFKGLYENRPMVEFEKKKRGIKTVLDVKIKNPGPTSLYYLKPIVFFDNKLEKTEEEIDILPPFARYEFEIEIPFSFLAYTLPEEVIVNLGSFQAKYKTQKSTVMLYNTSILLLLIALIILFLFVRFKKITFKKIKAYIFSHGQDS